jgi:hypothetical protein
MSDRTPEPGSRGSIALDEIVRGMDIVQDSLKARIAQLGTRKADLLEEIDRRSHSEGKPRSRQMRVFFRGRGKRLAREGTRERAIG